MSSPEVQDDLQRTLDAWCRTILERDAAGAAALRHDDYKVSLARGRTLTRANELEHLQSSQHGVEWIRVDDVRRSSRGTATATFQGAVGTDGSPAEPYTWIVDFRSFDGKWLAMRSQAVSAGQSRSEVAAPRAPSFPSLFRRLTRRLQPRTTFQDLAYLPYKPGEDFALPRTTPPDARAELPTPPRELWLQYNYHAHGKLQVEKMLEILHDSDFSFAPGDRVLDFGCGAGRMIRHLRSLTETCQVWGTDISSEHILWCKRHLAPPFRFATTTKVPHLPFADGSFRFIYCGSVFTHIDDLADAWLLELHRILAPDGRLYVTIHDNRTVELIENAEKGEHWLDWVRSRPAYRSSRKSFDMISIGRDNASQIFYDRDYFCRMASQAFDVVSITPEAYFYQTAVLLKPQ